ncbi:MAG: response regulator [Alphaproteobacteria bacterium]|nr:response regulator [Alphaproteobacteria bacterium]
MQLATWIRAAGYGLPLILLSSSPANAREGAGVEHLASILQKPILRAELYRNLQAISGDVVAEVVVAPPPPGERRKMRVLVAEDNRTNQLVFQKMVRDIEIDLVFADDGVKAVALWQSFQPDMIFMDISMPEMDERDAARAIRAAEGAAHVPIVALTAHATEGDAEGILAAGIDRYMTKPLRKQAITATLADFCPAEALPIAVATETAA